MNKLKKVLGTREYIALTTDLWKNHKLEYFLVLTSHFFDNNLDYTSVIMSFRKFKKSHNADNLKGAMLDEINRFGISEKLVSITSDNEACVAKACKNLNLDSTYVSCMAHNFNLAVKNGVKIWEKADQQGKRILKDLNI
jgi:hypothetical protein